MSDPGPERSAETRTKDWTFALVAVPGCMTSAVFGSLEAFAIADALRAGEGPKLNVVVAGPSQDSVTGFGGFEIPCTARLEDLQHASVIVIPPIIGSPEELASDNAAVVDCLGSAVDRGAITAATCTGTFLVAETGVLNGRRATTTPLFRELFKQRFPEVHLRTSLRIVDEGAVVTAGATTSYLDLALALIGRALGPRIALETARVLSTDPNPRSQQPFLLPRPTPEHPDEEVRKVEQWIAQNLTKACDTESLAGVAGLGERTFLRRFRTATGESPRQYLQRLRVEAAMKDLESTNLSIEEITYQCGYEDTRSFRRLFRKQTGISPGEYRSRFGYSR